MIDLIIYLALGIFFLAYFIYPLILLIQVKLKHGKECDFAYFPIIGGIFLGIVRHIIYKDVFADTNFRMKKNKDLKFLVMNRGLTLDFNFFDPLLAKEAF
jgi:hypothetical protein